MGQSNIEYVLSHYRAPASESASERMSSHYNGCEPIQDASANMADFQEQMTLDAAFQKHILSHLLVRLDEIVASNDKDKVQFIILIDIFLL